MKESLNIDGNNFFDFNGFVHEFNVNILGDNTTWMGGFGQLNDLLRGGYGSPEQPFTIHWINSYKSKEDLGQTATLAWLESRMNKSIHPIKGFGLNGLN